MTKKILIVDDIEVMRESMRNVLEDEKYDLSLAENGVMACRLLTVQHFDLVISDMLMPDMDGFELSKFIHNNFPEMKLIIISGGGRSYQQNVFDVDSLLRQVKTIINPDAIFMKPFDNQLFLEEVERLLSNE